MTTQDIKLNWEEVIEKAKDAATDSDRNFDDILVLAVSKTHSWEIVKNALDAGIVSFGENYAQELKDKIAIFNDMPQYKPQWHFIGHLQTNKVKYLAEKVTMIHSVDSFKLAKEIDKQAKKHDRTIDILLQINTSGEESKSGCEPDEVYKLAEESLALENINIKGLMTIGTFSSDERIIRGEFTTLRENLEKLQKEFGKEHFHHLSMGMTHDYDIAIDEGATIVRVGTAVFGQRLYKK